MPVPIKRAVNLAKGSGEPDKTKVGKISEKQVEEIGKIRMPDLNCFTPEPAMRSVKGTARSMGVDVVQASAWKTGSHTSGRRRAIVIYYRLEHAATRLPAA